jgi:methylthioribose-1-phosphate isomerase
MMFREREKKILVALPLQTVLRTTANKSQNNCVEKDKINISLLHCKSKVLTLCNAERLIQHIYNRPSDM